MKKVNKLTREEAISKAVEGHAVKHTEHGGYVTFDRIAGFVFHYPLGRKEPAGNAFYRSEGYCIVRNPIFGKGELK